jgi:hypothetical protein
MRKCEESSPVQSNGGTIAAIYEKILHVVVLGCAQFIEMPRAWLLRLLLTAENGWCCCSEKTSLTMYLC